MSPDGVWDGWDRSRAWLGRAVSDADIKAGYGWRVRSVPLLAVLGLASCGGLAIGGSGDSGSSPESASSDDGATDDSHAPGDGGPGQSDANESDAECQKCGTRGGCNGCIECGGGGVACVDGVDEGSCLPTCATVCGLHGCP